MGGRERFQLLAMRAVAGETGNVEDARNHFAGGQIGGGQRGQLVVERIGEMAGRKGFAAQFGGMNPGGDGQHEVIG